MQAASIVEKAAHHAEKAAALSPLFVNVFIPLAAGLGLLFAIWCVSHALRKF